MWYRYDVPEKSQHCILELKITLNDTKCVLVRLSDNYFIPKMNLILW